MFEDLTASVRAAVGASLTLNLRTQLVRIIHNAGLKPWPKLFQNLRATRETELTERWPEHVACAWIGNSRMVARKHYLQVTDEHFEQAARNGAAQKTAQQPAEMARKASQAEEDANKETPVLQGFATQCEVVPICTVGDTGCEHTKKSPGKPRNSKTSGANSGAPKTDEVKPAELDQVIASWPTLPHPIRAGIIAMIQATDSGLR